MSAADADFPSDLRSLEREYELIRELGQGGMAAVYLARQRKSGRIVAIKAIRSRYVNDPDAVQRFAREARTVAELDHPNIVRTEAIEQIGDRAVAIILEHVSGGTVRDRLREYGSLGAEQAEGILRDVANALGYAHRRGIVHRDVKPENIFLDPTHGRALLSDFGIARKIDNDAVITLLGAALGTPQYMSPEQIDGAMVDGRSDIYSLGVLGWELLTGRRPWAGESLYSVIYKQKHENLPRITSVRPRVPANLLFAIEGALIKDRNQRWQTTDEFLDCLTYNPPPLLSQTYPPGAVRIDDEPTVRFRSASLESGEQDAAAEGALWDAIASTEVRPRDEPRSPVVAPPHVFVAAEASERFPDTVTNSGTPAPAYSGDEYSLPDFEPNAERSFELTKRRTRILQTLGLLVPLGIAAGSLFVVLSGSAMDSTRRDRAQPTLTTSAGSIARDSAPPPRAVAPVANARDTVETPAPRAPQGLEGVVAGSSVSTGQPSDGAAVLTVRKPVFTSARVPGSTAAGSPVPATTGQAVRIDSNQAIASARPVDSNETTASKAGASGESRSGGATIDDPFKIPAAPEPALGANGSVPSPRCLIAGAADQRACLDAYVAVRDGPLNAAFESLVSEMRRVAATPLGAPDPTTVQRLRIEQRAWISIRTAECPHQAPTGVGPFWAQASADCFSEMAVARAAELRDAVRRLKRR